MISISISIGSLQLTVLPRMRCKVLIACNVQFLLECSVKYKQHAVNGIGIIQCTVLTACSVQY